MVTERKAETGRSTTPATTKANGKPKINNHDVRKKPPITRCSSSNSHNHNTNEAKSASKSPEEEEEQVVVVDDIPVNVPPMMRDEVEEEDGGLLYQIPMNRVSRIIKTEDTNVRITQEAVYVINKASEKFLHVFTTEAYASAFLDHKKHIDYKHLSSIVSKRKRLDFLSDFVPEKLKAEDALIESQTTEN